MRSIPLSWTRVFLGVLVLTATVPAMAHNVWCHCPKKDKLKTLAFFHLAGDVYEAQSQAVKLWHESNAPLEAGVLAEFEHTIDAKKPLKPERFRQTLAALQKLDVQLAVLDRTLAVVIDSLEGKDDEITPGFNDAVAKLLHESRDIRRVSQIGNRYADIATGGQGSNAMPDSVLGIYKAQRADLKIVRGLLSDVMAGLRDAIPLAEKGEFARVMLSGRNAFGDKMPQFTDMFSAYDRFYVQSCMATIAATMQIYPAGFEWLKTSKK